MAPAEREALAEYHGYLIQDHDIDYRVVTASQVGDINLFALSRFEELAPETRSITGRMLLLAVDPEQDLVRLEVGQALEGVFTDGFIAYVEHRQMVPFFRAGRVADGILATTELIVMRAQRAAANAGFEDEAWAARSGGAGATAPADLNAGPAARSSPAGPRPSAGTTPGATLRAYFMAMDSRDDDPDLAIYTPATRDDGFPGQELPALPSGAGAFRPGRSLGGDPLPGAGARLRALFLPEVGRCLGARLNHDAERDPLWPYQRLALLARCGPPLSIRVRGLAFRP
jgi:hypothetical protein